MAALLVVARGKAVQRNQTTYFQRQDALILRGLCSRGYRVTCLISIVERPNPLYKLFSVYDAQIWSDDFNIEPLPTYWAPSPGLWEKLAVWIGSARRIWHYIRKADHLLVFMPSPAGFIAFVIGLLFRRHMLVYYGGDWSAYLGGTSPGGSWTDKAYQTCAIRIRGILENLVFQFAPILLLRNAQNFEVLSQQRNGVYLASPATPFSIGDVNVRNDTCQKASITCLTVCALLPIKGIPDILNAVNLLRQCGHEIEWHHAGASYPEYYEEIKLMVSEMALSNAVTFHGYCNTLTLLSLYRQADIFVLASRSEGFPRVLIEAMSQSLPVIATRVGGMPAMLTNERQALLVEARSPGDLVTALLRIISDSALRQQLIRSGRNWAIQELSKANPAQQIDELLQTKSPITFAFKT